MLRRHVGIRVDWVEYNMKKVKKITDTRGEFHGSTSIGERGQVVIPKKLRDLLGIKKGKKFFVIEKAGAIMLLPIDLMESFMRNISKQLKGIKNK